VNLRLSRISLHVYGAHSERAGDRNVDYGYSGLPKQGDFLVRATTFRNSLRNLYLCFLGKHRESIMH
jgi:hypothetical protein